MGLGLHTVLEEIHFAHSSIFFTIKYPLSTDEHSQPWVRETLTCWLYGKLSRSKRYTDASPFCKVYSPINDLHTYVSWFSKMLENKQIGWLAKVIDPLKIGAFTHLLWYFHASHIISHNVCNCWHQIHLHLGIHNTLRVRWSWASGLQLKQ